MLWAHPFGVEFQVPVFQFLCVLFNYSPAERVVYIGNVWWIINLFSEL